jgi:hypothetical protein
MRANFGFGALERDDDSKKSHHALDDHGRGYVDLSQRLPDNRDL